jgi:hypothetical protein
MILFPRPMMKILTSMSILALVGAAACRSGTDLPPYRPIALVTVEVNPNARPSGYSASTTGFFFQERLTEISSSATPPNSCSSPQATTVVSNNAGTRWISPGTTPTLSLIGPGEGVPRTVPLRLATDLANRQFYVNDSLPTIYPGSDTATVTIPGAAGGFPALTMRARVVENFDMQPVSDSGDASGLVLQWTPATQQGTTMQVQLRYKTDPAFDVPNEQVICSVVDDGDFRIPASVLNGWRNAGNDAEPLTREAIFTRFFSRVYEQGDALAVLFTSMEKVESKAGL